MKRIIITGATGSIGKKLAKLLIDRGDEVVIFSRDVNKAKDIIPDAKEYIEWDYNNPGTWADKLNGADAIVHLAGANLSGKRWNKAFKEIAYNSRIISTRNLIEAINSVEKKPKVFISANAVGIYGDRCDEVLYESSDLGNDFLANLCKDWEAEVKKAEKYNLRWVSVRTGLVLIKGEGLLKQLYLPFKLFIGGPLAGGKQWFPWIHIDDMAGIYLYLLDNESVKGPFNAASPEIVRMKEFAKTFGKVIKRPAIFPIPKFAMKIVAGELADYAVMSQKTSVDKILNAGYEFKHPNLENALKELLK